MIDIKPKNGNEVFYCRPNSSDEGVIKECYSPMYFKEYMNYKVRILFLMLVQTLVRTQREFPL